MLRSTEYSILHRNERFMKKAVILYVPWTLSAYSLLFFQMSVLRFLFPPRRAGRTGRLCGRAATGAAPLCAGRAPAAGHPLFRRRHAQPAHPCAGRTAHPGSRPRARCGDHLGGKPRDRHRGEPAGLPDSGGEPHLLRGAVRPGHPAAHPWPSPQRQAGAGSLCRCPARRVREYQRRHHAGTAPLYAGRI